MIVSKAHNLTFLHVPKNGGSTIRHQIAEFHDLDQNFYGFKGHPDLGNINLGHLPIRILRDHFPDAFKVVRDTRVLMLSRDPLDRFISSMSQWFRSSRKVEPGDLSREDIHAGIDDVIAQLKGLGSSIPAELAIFLPQTDFSHLDGAQFVSRVVPLRRIDLLYDELETALGKEFMRDSVWNPTVTYKSARFKGPLDKAKKFAQKRLPLQTYARLRDLAALVLTQQGAPKFAEAVTQYAPAQSFVSDHYGKDSELHSQAVIDADATMAARQHDNTQQVRI